MWRVGAPLTFLQGSPGPSNAGQTSKTHPRDRTEFVLSSPSWDQPNTYLNNFKNYLNNSKIYLNNFWNYSTKFKNYLNNSKKYLNMFWNYLNNCNIV
jgi:hypothetical protein